MYPIPEQVQPATVLPFVLGANDRLLSTNEDIHQNGGARCCIQVHGGRTKGNRCKLREDRLETSRTFSWCQPSWGAGCQEGCANSILRGFESQTLSSLVWRQRWHTLVGQRPSEGPSNWTILQLLSYPIKPPFGCTVLAHRPQCLLLASNLKLTLLL